jgi:hypothetical protein
MWSALKPTREVADHPKHAEKKASAAKWIGGSTRWKFTVVQYDAEVSDKKTKERRKLSEVGVYTVKNGKIVREEFLPRVGG